MWAWSHLALRLQNFFGRKIRYAGRDASSSPATGSLAIHLLEQNQLVQEAFGAPVAPKPAEKKSSKPLSIERKVSKPLKRKKKK
jgi:hypothetical protein